MTPTKHSPKVLREPDQHRIPYSPIFQERSLGTPASSSGALSHMPRKIDLSFAVGDVVRVVPNRSRSERYCERLGAGQVARVGGRITVRFAAGLRVYLKSALGQAVAA